MLTHLSPFVPLSVLDLLKKDPDLLTQEKKKREVSVLFLDLEGYTHLSTSLPEVEVNALVERLFSSFVDPIHRSHGDINETAGDGLMIIFKEGDLRDTAVNAVKAAFEIHERSLDFNKTLPEHVETVHVNMGINSGTALVGMTRFKGAVGTRMTYTASGPVTNLAARLAGHARQGDILISEKTRELVEGLWPLYRRETASLKGIEEPVKIASLLHEV
jgi:class 3 adenylate cyclase